VVTSRRRIDVGNRPERGTGGIVHERGQGLIEFALVSTVLLLVILGLADFSRMMYYQSALNSASRVGAEMASNHCQSAVYCSISGAPTTYDFVMQAAECEAPNLPLQPSLSCTQVSTVNGSPCAGTCPAACGQDVCINPAFNPGSSQILGAPQDVAVSVGYHFSPISPLMKLIVESDANPAWKNGCFPGDVPHAHTLCAKSIGRAF
jgi:TadE-like protein